MRGMGERWIRFLRQYGPIPHNDSMFDEQILRSSARLGVAPVSFAHPLHDAVISVFAGAAAPLISTVLTGTAGDGKSHLCGRVWSSLGGDASSWASDEIYFQIPVMRGDQRIMLHVIRDLTALPDIDPGGRYANKGTLLEQLSASLFDPAAESIFLLAANDGQLIERWRKLGAGPNTQRAHRLFEARLMGDQDPEPGACLAFFNLSSVPSATVLDLALSALLKHGGWPACYAEAEPDGFFGPQCPIRKNYEVLSTPLVQARLRALFQLCDYNELHTPIRRVLMLVSNGILGHPDARDRLLQPRDIRGLIANGKGYRASLYANLFGANLTATKRETLEIFDYLCRFGVGQETTNRIDNILIFGTEDESLRAYYEALVASDPFYGATDRYIAAQHDYVESPELAEGDRHVFLDMMTEQRRALFFKIPDDLADELKLWQLTVFTRAGEYLDEVAAPLLEGRRVARRIVAKLVNGLNRIFTGMLIASERELLLATSLSYSSARISQLLEDRVSIAPRGQHERIDITLEKGFPTLNVHLPDGAVRALRLNLTRYEFLTRVSDGALPGNFSRECYEDILAFKSALLAAATQARRSLEGEGETQDYVSFRMLHLDDVGNPVDNVVEVANA